MPIEHDTHPNEVQLWTQVLQARAAYGDAVRKTSGAEYMVHPHLVALLVMRFKGRSHAWKDLFFAALNHDVLEDTKESPQSLLSRVGPRAFGLILELSNDDAVIAKVGKLEHHKRKLRGISGWALDIKLCDMLANACASPSPSQTETIRQLVAYLRTGVRVLSATQLAILEELDTVLSTLSGA